MDINEALRIMRAESVYAQQCMDDDTTAGQFCVVPNHAVSAIVEAFGAIDGWLSRGGLLPDAWQR